MSNQGNYIAYVAKARQWDLDVATQLHISEEQAHRIIRSVLRVFRQQLPMEESLQLMAQLPLIWKGIYSEGWQPMKEIKRLHKMGDWLDAIRSSDQQLAAFDFGNDEKALKVFLSVWSMINKNISNGELTQICNCLPQALQEQINKLVESN